MKESSEKAMEVYNELRLNVDADEVQEIIAARTPMKNNKHVCVTCNKTLALKNGCKKHIKEDHTELC